jgi:uncharacterized protein with PQ loop repeat
MNKFGICGSCHNSSSYRILSTSLLSNVTGSVNLVTLTRLRISFCSFLFSSFLIISVYDQVV